MKDLEKRVVDRLDAQKEPKKKRYTFFLDKEVKEAFAKWCIDKRKKESPALEALIREMVPARFFK